MVAPPKTDQAEFNSYSIRSTAEIAAMPAVLTSTIEALPSCQLTYAISASEPTFTPSRNAPTHFDLRIRGIKGPLAATNTRLAGEFQPSPRLSSLIHPANVR
jgi:hypothetical protein